MSELAAKKFPRINEDRVLGTLLRIHQTRRNRDAPDVRIPWYTKRGVSVHPRVSGEGGLRLLRTVPGEHFLDLFKRGRLEQLGA